MQKVNKQLTNLFHPNNFYIIPFHEKDNSSIQNDYPGFKCFAFPRQDLNQLKRLKKIANEDSIASKQLDLLIGLKEFKYMLIFRAHNFEKGNYQFEDKGLVLFFENPYFTKQYIRNKFNCFIKK